MSETPGDTPEPGRTPRLPPAYRLVALDSVDSTNAEALRRARDGAEDGTVVWAREQTQGRGRRGRGWTSPPGNLYVSLVLRPEVDMPAAAQLGFVAAVALVEALGSLLPPLVEVALKWPNDLLVNDRKAAGILLESETAPDGGLQALILGLGVNIAQYPDDPESSYPPTSLRAEGAGGELDDAALLEAFGRYFLAWVNRWLDEGFPPVRAAWKARARGMGDSIEVRLPNETLHGTFRDLDTEGRLVLDTGTGAPRRISVGDVFFGR